MKYSGRLLRVRNLPKYQHYKDRNPPWIKLHQETLEDYDFGELPDALKYHALAIMLLASRTDNSLPDDAGWIGRKINAKTRVDLAALVSAGFLEVYQDASEPLAKGLQDALLETEGEKRREEGEPTPSLQPAEPTQRIFARHLTARRRFYAHRNGKAPSKDPDLTPELRRAIREAIRRHGVEKAMAAGVGIFYSTFHTGKNEHERLYLDPALCWRINGKQDNVERFADLYFNEFGREEIADE